MNPAWVLAVRVAAAMAMAAAASFNERHLRATLTEFVRY
jgi:hypothetical protein